MVDRQLQIKIQTKKLLVISTSLISELGQVFFIILLTYSLIRL